MNRFRTLDERLRSHPRGPLVLLAPAILLAIAVPAAIGMDDGGGTGAATPTTFRPVTTQTTATRPTTTTVSTTTSTSAGSDPTTTTAAPTTTTPAAGGQPPASTTTTQAAVRCGPDAFSTETVTGEETYAPGESVQITSSVTNRSSTPCAISGYTFVWSVANEAGATVGLESSTQVDNVREPLRPGQRFTSTPTWDALVCSPSGACTLAPPGTYTVVASWRVSDPAPPLSRATFRVEA